MQLQKKISEKNEYRYKLHPRVSVDEYAVARVFAERRCGSLRFLPAGFFFSSILLIFLIWTFDAENPVATVVGTLFCLLIYACVFLIIPKAIKARATEEYVYEEKFANGVSLVFGLDQLITKSDKFSICDSYADMFCCVETKDMFVLVKDRKRMALVLKNQLSDDECEQFSEFIRTTFARKIYIMKNIAF